LKWEVVLSFFKKCWAFSLSLRDASSRSDSGQDAFFKRIVPYFCYDTACKRNKYQRGEKKEDYIAGLIVLACPPAWPAIRCNCKEDGASTKTPHELQSPSNGLAVWIGGPERE
jgi:hypothetical protein